MNITEEAGKVASGAVDALKGSPGLLVLVLLQAATMVMLYFAVENNRQRQQEREMTMLERCFPINREKI